MNPQSSTWNRLIFLVLCLNLVCLALLLYRAYWGPGTSEQEANTSTRQLTQPAQEQAAEETGVQPTSSTPRSQGNPAKPNHWPGATQGLVAEQPSPANLPAVPIPAPPAVAPLVNLPTRASKVTPAPGVAGGTARFPELTGRVTLKGVPPPEIPINMGSTCGRLRDGPVTTRHYLVGPDDGLANVLVWLKHVPHWERARDLPATETPTIETRGCLFEPYVSGVVAGRPLRLLNSDDTLHNVHATPRDNREFNFGMPPRGEAIEFSFANPELFIRLKSDVHPWMFAYVNVLNHPFFAITDTNGAFRLPSGFPPGRYVVGARHLKAEQVSRELDLPAGAHSVEFELQVPERAQARVGRD